MHENDLIVANCSNWSLSLTHRGSSSGGGSVDVRTTRYEYTSDSWLKKLVSDNVATGTQTTEWVYGVDPSKGSTISSKRLVYRKLFPGATQPVTYLYNRQLQITGQTDQLGTERAFAYDKLGRLLSDTVDTFGTGVDDAVGKLGNGYDNRGRLIRASSFNTAGTAVLNEIAWEYNGFSQPVAEYQEHGGAVNKTTSLKVGYTYADGSANTTRPTGIKYPHVGTSSATTVAIEYSGTAADALSRPDQIKDGSSVLSSWRYVGLGMVVAQKYDTASNAELTYGSSTNDYAGYDRFGGIAATLWKSGSTVLVESEYGRNVVGGVTWRKDVKAHAMSVTTQDNHYWYDGLQQVKRHDRGELTPSGGPPYTGITNLQQQEDFTYDETGNWKGYQSTAPTLVQSRTHNVANQITDIVNPTGVVDPLYDLAGNMTRMPKPGEGNWGYAYTCKWDAWNRLVEIKQGSTVVQTNTYDARTRRINQETPSEMRSYYYDGQWRALEERVLETVKVDYAYSPFDRWDLIRRRRSVNGTLDEIRFVLRDYVDPVAIIEEDGTVDERYGYDAFGPVRIMNASFAARSSSVCGWNWLFHGEFIDTETGLYNYGYRYYHPQLGRWLGRDPLGEFPGEVAQSIGQMVGDGIFSEWFIANEDVLGSDPIFESEGYNLYWFCMNNAIDGFDVTGGRFRFRLPRQTRGNNSGKKPAAKPKSPPPPPKQLPPRPVNRRTPSSRDPGDCTKQMHAMLQAAVDAACKIGRACACRPKDCAGWKVRVQVNKECAQARRTINQKCYKGGDRGHRKAADDTINAMKNCQELIDKKCH